MKGSIKYLTYYTCFLLLFFIYKNDTFLYGVFSKTCLVLSVLNLIEIIKLTLPIEDKGYRRNVLISDLIICSLVGITAFFVIGIIGGFYTGIILILEISIYGYFFSPKFLKRNFY